MTSIVRLVPLDPQLLQSRLDGDLHRLSSDFYVLHRSFPPSALLLRRPRLRLLRRRLVAVAVRVRARVGLDPWGAAAVDPGCGGRPSMAKIANCCPRRKTLEVVQYTTRPAGKFHEMNPMNSGMTRVITCWVCCC
jgi:hypothetical protein